MKHDSRALAFGGVVAALCWTLLISSGMLPFMTYTMPAAAGLVLLLAAFENGASWAYLTYVAVSILCLIMSTDIEAGIVFITLFGYYPTLRLRLQVMRPKWMVALLKTLLFTLAVLLNYVFVTFAFSMSYLTEEIMDMPPILIAISLLILLAVFWAYDTAVGNMTRFYIVVIRPRINRGAV